MSPDRKVWPPLTWSLPVGQVLSCYSSCSFMLHAHPTGSLYILTAQVYISSLEVSKCQALVSAQWLRRHFEGDVLNTNEYLKETRGVLAVSKGKA